jgi:molybdate transport system ATP-binding protein
VLEVALRGRLGAFELDVAFVAATPGIVALFGPSGAGKTSVVEAIAGLLRPRAGRIVVDGAVFLDTEAGVDLPAERRRVGYVFQDARLFPHLGVAANLRYGLRRAPAGERRIGFDAVVELLGIAHLLGRRPHRLSGGERQRVALGRALLAQPRLLLMDEPLAALDAERRQEVLPYLERLHAELALPVIYVSHAMSEVVRLADSLVLIERGRVAAAGSLAEISRRTDLPLFATRFGAGAVLDAVVDGHDPTRGLTRLAIPGAALLVPLLDLPVGARRRVRVRVRARDVILAAERPRAVSVRNVLPARVVELRPLGPAQVAARVDLGGSELVAQLTRDAVAELGLAPGVAAFALVKSVAVDGAAPARGAGVDFAAGHPLE